MKFVAKITKLNEPSVDPATGKIPERKFILPEEFLEYCPWGEIGSHIVHLARKKINSTE